MEVTYQCLIDPTDIGTHEIKEIKEGR